MGGECTNQQSGGYWGLNKVRTKDGDVEDCVGKWTSHLFGTLSFSPEPVWSSSPSPMSVNHRLRCPICDGITGPLGREARALNLSASTVRIAMYTSISTQVHKLGDWGGRGLYMNSFTVCTGVCAEPWAQAGLQLLSPLPAGLWGA